MIISGPGRTPVRYAAPGPLIVGGGINTPDQALLAFQAGADVIVVGNALEKDPDLIPPIARQRKIAGRKG